MKKISPKKKKITALVLSLCLLLSAVPFTVFAADSVDYLDESGSTLSCSDYTVIDSSSTAMSGGWYVLAEDTEISSLVTITGDVSVILKDGCTLTCSAGINVAGSNSLTIYAQSTAKSTMGALVSTGTATRSVVAYTYQAAIGGGSGETNGAITINGGIITATAASGGTGGTAGIGTGSGSVANQLTSGAITINGGYVTATGSTYGAGIGGGYYGTGTNITINGGEVEATGGTYGAGIGGGSQGSGTNITIAGGTVTATSGSTTLSTAVSLGRGYSGSASDIYIVAPEDIGCSLAAFVGSSSASDLLDGAPFAAGTTSDDFADYSSYTSYQYFYSYEINEHAYSYTAEGSVITAACENCGDEQTAEITASDTTYNGSAQETASVSYSSGWFYGTLDIAYASNTSAGTATASIMANGVTASTEFTIYQKSIADATVSVSNIAAQCYTGEALTPEITVYDSETGKNLTAITDYSVEYTDNTDIGTATVTVTGAGNYTGETETQFTISSHSYVYTASGNVITETCTNCGITATATITAENVTYDGTAQQPATVSYSSGWAGGELAVIYENNTEVGTATASITVGGATASVTFEVEVDGIYYLDENGEKQVCGEFTVMDSSSTTLASGWYAVTADTTVSSLVTVSGDVHLILADGCTLTCSSGINVVSGNSITIYAQSTSESTMGVLNTTGSDRQAGIGGGQNNGNGTIVINGGNITAVGGGSTVAYSAAGIGTGAGGLTNKVTTGEITINGGIVNASSSQCAGIGGGYYGTGSNITINGGTVTATGGSLGAGIGGGSQGSASNIVITGGTVTATGGSSSYPAIGRGYSGSTASGIYIAPSSSVVCSIDAYTSTSSIDPSSLNTSNRLSDSPYASGTTSADLAGSFSRYFYSYEINSHDYTYTASGNVITTLCANCGTTATAMITAQDAVYDATAKETATVTYSGDWQDGELEITYQNNTDPGTATASITAGGVTASTTFAISAQGIDGDVPYLDENGDTQNCSSYTLVGNTALWASNWYVVSGNISISERVTVSGNVYLILVDGSSISIDGGLYVRADSSLTIYAQSTDESTMGVLTATGGSYEAGIGGGDTQTNGAVTIVGGTINATGGKGAAGIGGGYPKAGSSITVLGGIVTAQGGTGGAGIGGGWFGEGSGITISGGTVTATGGYNAAGIGGGAGAAGEITISGGTVTALSGYNADGVGNGYTGSSSSVIISPENVLCSITAKAGKARLKPQNLLLRRMPFPR